MDKKTAVKSAMASMEMEGFIFTLEEKKMFDQLINGEITYSDIDKIILAKIAKWKNESPESFTEEV